MQQQFRIEETDNAMFLYEKTPKEFRRGGSSTAGSDKDYGVEKRIAYDKAKDGANIFTWGKDNKQPQRREQLIKSNNIVGSLLQTRRDIVLGNGLTMFREIWEKDDDGGTKRRLVEEQMPKEVKEWLEKSYIDHYFRVALKNLFFHANTFTEMITSKDGKSITSIEHKECRHIRAEVQDDDGIIQNYYYSMNWSPKRGSNRRKLDLARIRGFHPLYHGMDFPKGNFLYHTGDELLTDDYYFEPVWWGGKDWIETANNVPKFHNANFRNGYTLRWHIQYPKDYFDTDSREMSTKEDLKKSKDKVKTRKSDFMSRVNELLAGVENTGRAIYTSYEINRAMDKEFPGIKITPIKADLQGDSLLKLFEKSNQANISAQGIHPTLANIETQGKLSSGSEMLNAFNSFLKIKTPTPRKILLEPLELVKKINGWAPELFFGFRDIELTKLDENKEGHQIIAVE